jgi:uncharacterized protein YjbJ (UPF0337 family)
MRKIAPKPLISLTSDAGPLIAQGSSSTHLRKEIKMNWDMIEGNWKQYKGKVKEQWGKLTDDHLDTIAGKRDQLIGKIQETYGINRDEAESQIRDFEDRNWKQ